jgi:hypothetical protein
MKQKIYLEGLITQQNHFLEAMIVPVSGKSDASLMITPVKMSPKLKQKIDANDDTCTRVSSGTRATTKQLLENHAEVEVVVPELKQTKLSGNLHQMVKLSVTKRKSMLFKTTTEVSSVLP